MLSVAASSLRPVRTTTSILSGALVVAATLAGCGGDDDTAEPPAEGTLVVEATNDLRFDKETYTAEAGEVPIQYVNTGSTAHTLLIEDVDDFKLEVGNTDEGTVELEAGTYTMYCDVSGHEEAGMTATLEVE